MLHMSMCSTSRQPRELCSRLSSGSCCEMRTVSSAEQHVLFWYQLQLTASLASGAGAERAVHECWLSANETLLSGHVGFFRPHTSGKTSRSKKWAGPKRAIRTAVHIGLIGVHIFIGVHINGRN